MKTILALFLLVTTISCRSASPPADPALRDIDKFAAMVVRTIPEVPSIGVAIVKDGRRYAHAFGLADVEQKVATTPRTGYYIGSTTKAFTGLVAAILAERKKIDLDAPVTTYLPELQFPAPIDASRVTLRRLLSHSASIENHPIVFRTAYTGVHDTPTLLRLLNMSKPRSEAFRYDNLGYVVAGLVFERVTGRTWQQLHDELVFTPLGMTRSTGVMSEARRAPMARPYELLASGNVELLDLLKSDKMMHAAGGTVMTTEDLARWLEANLHGSKQIPAGAFAEIQRAQVNVEKARGPYAGTAYGFGWYRGSIGDDTVLFHGGGWEGWRSLFSLMPDRGFAVGVLTNSGVSNPINSLVTSYAYDRLRGKTNIDAEYGEKLAKLRANLDKEKTETAAETRKRAERPWKLTRERGAYAGHYENALFGTMIIEERDGKLFATLGAMGSELEPFTEPDSARVELIPAEGEVLQFIPEGLRLRNEVFTRK